MTTNDRSDRSLSQWLDEKAGRQMPDYLDEILAVTSQTKQRRAWPHLRRWLPLSGIDVRLGSVRRPAMLVAILVLLLALLIALAAGMAGHRLPKPFGPAGNGLIAYAHDGDIYVANADGTGRRPLIAGPNAETSPSWSPDGQSIAWFRVLSPDTGLVSDVMVAAADGSGAHAVLTHVQPLCDCAIPPLLQPEGARPPDWSPDGLTLAVPVTPNSGPFDTLLVNRDGSGSRSFEVPGLFESRSLTWSPDGHKFAFLGVPSDLSGLDAYVANIDGTGLVSLSMTPGGSGLRTGPLAWTPDGSAVIAEYGASSPVQLQRDIILLAADGSGGRVLAGTSADEYFPQVSPDGKRVAYVVTTGSQTGVSVIDLAGGPATVLLADGIAHFPVRWSPDGRFILAFHDGDVDLGLGPELWLLDPTGVAPRQVIGGWGAQTVVEATRGDSYSWQRRAP